MTDREVLHSPFSIERHKQHFINYLEVLILEDGTVTYAVPSHQLAMIHLLAKKKGMTEREVFDLCPPEFHLDVMVWLSKETGAIPVWNEFHQARANEAQEKRLIELREHGLYKGPIQTIDGRTL